MTLILNPGNLTSEELANLDRHYLELTRQADLLAEGHERLDHLFREGDHAAALALLPGLQAIAQVHDDAVFDWRQLFATAWLYDDAEGTPHEPPAGTDIPGGANTVVWLIDQLAEQLGASKGFRGAAGDVYEVQLPAGDLPAFGLGVKAGRDTADVRWLGEATLRIVGRGRGNTRINPMHDEPGWGTTISFSGGGEWGGRVTVRNVTVEASGGSCVSTSVPWGTTKVLPYKALVFEECGFVDHPLASVECVRPFSINQAALWCFGCTWDLPNSREHAVYRRNGYGGPGAGRTGMSECVIIACGGNGWQDVARPSEGPAVVRHEIELSTNEWLGCHRHPGRAGSQVTIAGSGCDWTVTGNLFRDVYPSPKSANVGKAGQTYGGLVAWNGGRYYLLDGTLVDRDIDVESPDPAGVQANGRLRLEGNGFVQLNSDRATVSLKDVKEAIVRRNVVLGRGAVLGHGKGVQPFDLGRVVWEENNQPDDVQMLGRRLPTEMRGLVASAAVEPLAFAAQHGLAGGPSSALVRDRVVVVANELAEYSAAS